QHPDWAPDRLRAEAGKQITDEDAARARGVDIRNAGQAQAQGTEPTIYDDLPSVTVDPTPGTPTPASVTAFEAAVRAKPQGKALLNMIDQLGKYKMNPQDIPSRQIGGLNRERAETLTRLRYPNYDPSTFPQRQALKLDWQPKGKAGQAMTSSRQLIGHL